MATAAAPRKRPRNRKPPVPQKECDTCGRTMTGSDGHDSCVLCLGRAHAVRGLNEGAAYCMICAAIETRYLRKRVRKFEKARPEDFAVEEPGEEPPSPLLGESSSPPVHDWGGEMERVDPILEGSLEDHVFVHPDDRERTPVFESSSEGPSDSEVGAYGDDIPPPTEEEEGELPAAQPMDTSARGSDTGSVAPTPPPLDTTELQELLKRAAVRCALPWPQEETGVAPVASVFDAFGGARPKSTAAPTVPFMPICRQHATASWENPVTAPVPTIKNLAVTGAKEEGLDAIPPIEGAMATHLLSTGHSDLFRQKGFVAKKDKDFSALNLRSFKMSSAAVQVSNASALLGGSAVQILMTAGDTPTPEQLAEVRRLLQEVMAITRTTIEVSGRAMAYAVALERARWMDYAKVSDGERAEILNRRIDPDRLFGDAMEKMTLRVERREKEERAMKACLPKLAAPATASAPRRFPPTARGAPPARGASAARGAPTIRGPGQGGSGGAFRGGYRGGRFQPPPGDGGSQQPGPRPVYKGAPKKKRGT